MSAVLLQEARGLGVFRPDWGPSTLLVPEGDSAFGEVVGAHSDRDLVSEDHADAEGEVFREVGVDLGTRLGFHEKRSPGYTSAFFL